MYSLQPKSCVLADSPYTLVEPSTGVYRVATGLIRHLPKIDEDSVDVSLFQSVIVLACLHENDLPVLITFMKKHGFESYSNSIAAWFGMLDADKQKAVQVIQDFADTCPISFMRNVFEAIDRDIMPVTKKEQDKVKND